MDSLEVGDEVTMRGDGLNKTHVYIGKRTREEGFVFSGTGIITQKVTDRIYKVKPQNSDQLFIWSIDDLKKQPNG
jgi:hypothetical protein